MRQGCLLSPSLFILALQVWDKDMRRDLTGLKVKKEIYKLKVFVGDLVLILEKNPLGKRIDVVMEKLREFDAMAGFKINKGKVQRY